MKFQNANNHFYEMGPRVRQNRPKFIAVIIGIFLFSCNFDDDERCTKGYDFDPVGHTCVPVEETDDTGSDTETFSTADEGSDSAGDTDETGIGTPCTPNGTECDGLEASYCAINPMSGNGYCTLEGCTSDTSTCPPSYTCCDMPFAGIPNFCATKEDAELMGTQCGKP